jgi:predicted ATP-grasp superfamily ATP-dependent carboligase
VQETGLTAWAARYRARTSSDLDGILAPAFQERSRAMPPAVVAPAFNATGLGIVRDLGRNGVPVIAVDHHTKSIGLASRYAVPRLSHDPRYDEDGLLEDLERIGAALPRRAVLFPAFDDHVWVFSRHAERLEKYFILPFARWAVMQRLVDKEMQLQAARAVGVDTPRTFFVHEPDDLKVAANEIPFPALFKPLRHQEMRRRFGVKVVLAQTADDLPAAYEKARVCGSLMLQEVVPGDDQDFFTFGAYHDASSRPLAQFVSRKIRQHPRDFGESRVAQSEWMPDVAAASLDLLGELSYHGVSGTEFKRDPRDGRLKLMEVNARHWLHHTLATAAGVNLSWVAYSDAIGAPFEASQQRDGVRWLDVEREVRDSLLELLRGQLDARQLLSGLRGVRVDAVYALDDPAPAVLEMANGLGRDTRRLVGQIGQRRRRTSGRRSG